MKAADENRPNESLRIGVEIGGTKLQVGIGSNEGGLYKLIRRQVDRENGAQGIRISIISMVDEVLGSTKQRLVDIEKIGIGFGGLVDENRGLVLKSFQIDGWDNFPLKKWAERQWGRPVALQNDASTAAIAESMHGSGRGYSRIFYITLGSGIGGGWVVNGDIDGGQGYGAAEIGHIYVPHPKTGKPTELEQICSGWSIGRRARLAAEINPKSRMTEIAGTVEKIDAEVVYLAAESGDETAKLVLEETCQTLGLAISNVIVLLHPECVIIGGGVSLMGSLFWDSLQREVEKRTNPFFYSMTEIVKAELGENVVVIGALCL